MGFIFEVKMSDSDLEKILDHIVMAHMTLENFKENYSIYLDVPVKVHHKKFCNKSRKITCHTSNVILKTEFS